MSSGLSLSAARDRGRRLSIDGGVAVGCTMAIAEETSGTGASGSTPASVADSALLCITAGINRMPTRTIAPRYEYLAGGSALE